VHLQCTCRLTAAVWDAAQPGWRGRRARQPVMCAVPTAPAWLQRAGLGADVMGTRDDAAGERGRWASNVDYAPTVDERG